MRTKAIESASTSALYIARPAANDNSNRFIISNILSKGLGSKFPLPIVMTQQQIGLLVEQMKTGAIESDLCISAEARVQTLNESPGDAAKNYQQCMQMLKNLKSLSVSYDKDMKDIPRLQLPNGKEKSERFGTGTRSILGATDKALVRFQGLAGKLQLADHLHTKDMEARTNSIKMLQQIAGKMQAKAMKGERGFEPSVYEMDIADRGAGDPETMRAMLKQFDKAGGALGSQLIITDVLKEFDNTLTGLNNEELERQAAVFKRAGGIPAEFQGKEIPIAMMNQDTMMTQEVSLADVPKMESQGYMVIDQAYLKTAQKLLG